jgi:hypothetical protein
MPLLAFTRVQARPGLTEVDRVALCGQSTHEPIGLDRILEPGLGPAVGYTGLNGAERHLPAVGVEQRQLASRLRQTTLQISAAAAGPSRRSLFGCSFTGNADLTIRRSLSGTSEGAASPTQGLKDAWTSVLGSAGKADLVVALLHTRGCGGHRGPAVAQIGSRATTAALDRCRLKRLVPLTGTAVLLPHRRVMLG